MLSETAMKYGMVGKLKHFSAIQHIWQYPGSMR